MMLVTAGPGWLTRATGYLAGMRRGLPRRQGVRVFYYHGVVERKGDPRLERNLHTIAAMRAHARFLRRYRVLSLAELASELATPGGPGGPAAVLTFDDGYRNNLVVAEIMDEARLPWSLFVSTGAVGPQGVVWTVELSLLLLHGRAGAIRLWGESWDLADRPARDRAFEAIRRRLKSSPTPERLRAFAELRGQFPEGETRRLLDLFPSLRMLTWSEVAQLASAGVEIGSHGVGHELHHAGQDEATRRAELAESKAVLEARLGRPCRFFAFPNGDVHPESATEVASAGYDLALTTRPASVAPGADARLLPRLPAPESPRAFVQTFYWDPSAVPV